MICLDTIVQVHMTVVNDIQTLHDPPPDTLAHIRQVPHITEVWGEKSQNLDENEGG